MSVGQWDKRFLASTRGKLIDLLRSGDFTVDHLARELGLTDNAVRSHLAALERDGLVHQAGVQRGVSKPAFVYGLTREANQLFPKSDGTLLRNLLDVLADRMPTAEFREVLAETGRLTASQLPPAHGTLAERARQSGKLVDDLGGVTTIEQTDSGYAIQGSGCPFAAVCEGHTETCQLVAALLSEFIDAPVEARCNTDDPEATPRCRFEISPPDPGDEP